MRTIHKIDQIAYHRNGISGAPFHIIQFTTPEREKFLAVVFDEPYHVAVFNIDLLLQGNIAFGDNSYRGDVFEPELRAAICDYEHEEG